VRRNNFLRENPRKCRFVAYYLQRAVRLAVQFLRPRVEWTK
jgi:hypothetical protein